MMITMIKIMVADYHSNDNYDHDHGDDNYDHDHGDHGDDVDGNGDPHLCCSSIFVCSTTKRSLAWSS